MSETLSRKVSGLLKLCASVKRDVQPSGKAFSRIPRKTDDACATQKHGKQNAREPFYRLQNKGLIDLAASSLTVRQSDSSNASLADGPLI